MIEKFFDEGEGMQMEIDDLIARIRADDFNNLVFFYLLSNDTSRSRPLEGDKMKIFDVDGESLKIDVPERTCAKGHVLKLYIAKTEKALKELNKALASRKPIPSSEELPDLMSIPCKVYAVIKHKEDKREEVHANLIEIKNRDWVRYLELIVERQKSINQVISSIRLD